MTSVQWSEVRDHLFPGDRDEHGAVLRCGVARTPRGNRLLVRDVVLAVDGVDYVEGDFGYRKLTADFVHRNIDVCAEEGLAYLAVHCHGGTDSAGFSEDDFASHDRGYPALRDIADGPPVGALVFASRAVAGDIWVADGSRHEISHLRVVGRPTLDLYDAPRTPRTADERFDRQARLFGDLGQARLAGMKVAVVGLGGAGSLINEYLARLGVGELLLIDPDHLEKTNLSRVVGSRRGDAIDPEAKGLKRLIQMVRKPFARSKVRVARDVAREANPAVRVHALRRSVIDPDVALQLRDCDHVFLAADSALARRLVGAVSHQFLVPTTQVGAKVQVNSRGSIVDIFSVFRSSTPGSGCLTCNGLVSSTRLQEEATDPAQRRRQRYVDAPDVQAPSVITLNAVASSHAVDDWLMSTMGLLEEGLPADRWVEYHQADDAMNEVTPRKDPDCRICGPQRFALGDLVRLPTPIKHSKGNS